MNPAGFPIVVRFQHHDHDHDGEDDAYRTNPYCFDEHGDTPESLPVEVSPRAAKASKELVDSAFLEATAAGFFRRDQHCLLITESTVRHCKVLHVSRQHLNFL